MSTKSTILLCEPIHIYDELLEGDVQLDIEKGAFPVEGVRLMKSSEFPDDLRVILREWSRARASRDAELRLRADGGKGGAFCQCAIPHIATWFNPPRCEYCAKPPRPPLPGKGASDKPVTDKPGGVPPQAKKRRACAVCGKDLFRKKVWETSHGKVIGYCCMPTHTFCRDGSVRRRDEDDPTVKKIIRPAA